MVDDDKPRFTELITALYSGFDRPVDKARLEAFWIGLSDCPLTVVERGVGRALRECRFPPSPSEIRKLGGMLSLEDRAQRGFLALKDAMRRYGHYKTVNFDDPLINATVRLLGGWIPLFDVDPDEFDKWFPSKFVKAYTTLYNRGVKPSEAAPLLGQHEINNRRDGYLEHVPEAIAITSGLPRLEENPVRLKDSRRTPMIEHVAKGSEA